MRFPSSRWCLWLSAALLLAGAVALGCALTLGPSRRVTEANFEKLLVGMDPEQVDEILGLENALVPPIQSWFPSTLSIRYEEEDGEVAITAEFERYYILRGQHPERPHRLADSVRYRLTDKRLEWRPLTLADFLRGQLAKVRRRLGL